MQGVFVSVSATTNGGLDITGESLVPYAKDYFVQTIVMFLIVLGSIGFPVLLELKAYIKNRVTNFRFSLFTKITTTTYLFLFLFGVIVVLILEHSNAFKRIELASITILCIVPIINDQKCRFANDRCVTF